MTKPLRAVQPGEAAPTKAKKLTVAEAAASGSYRDLLIATRDRIAQAVSAADCPPRDLAALTRRLTDIGKELATLEARDAEDADGEGASTPDDEWEAV
jgi:hypothetical protein